MIKNVIIIYVNLGLRNIIIKNVEDKEMFHLIVTNDPELVKKARECGAGVFTAEKCPEGVATLVAHTTGQRALNAYELLRKLDVRPNIKGYDYLKFLMEKCAQDPSYHSGMITKEIYPECAKKFNTTLSRVERAIRHALELSFGKAPEKYSEVFGGTFKKVPTNSQFIGLVSEYFANNK